MALPRNRDAPGWTLAGGLLVEIAVRGIRDDHPVATLRLGAVQRRISREDQLLDRRAVLRVRGNADGQRRSRIDARRFVELEGLDPFTKPFPAALRVFERRLWQDDNELLAPESTGDVLCPHGGREEFADPAK